MCPNFDIVISEASTRVIHLTRYHPPCQRMCAVGGYRGGVGAIESQHTNPMLSDCESRAKAKRNQLKSLVEEFKPLVLS